MGFKILGFDKLKRTLGQFTEAGRLAAGDFRAMVLSQAGRLQTILQRNAPKKSGQYAAGIKTVVTGNDEHFKITVTDPQPLGKWLRFGTKAHGPVNAKFLRFEIGGRVIFTKWVRGIKPNKFMDYSIGEWELDATRALNSVASQYVETANGN